MDPDTLTTTRHALHAIAEFVLAGPQHHQSRTVRLRAFPGGFGTVAAPDLRVEGLELVGPAARVPLNGTCSALARAVGVEARALRDVYADGPALGVDDPVLVDPEATRLILDAFAVGDAALRAFAPGEQPVLWPEHFDIAITAAEVNYGVSPGDSYLAEPYVYVGPWARVEGDFWNAPFGAALPMTDFADVGALARFFEAGAREAGAPPGS